MFLHGSTPPAFLLCKQTWLFQVVCLWLNGYLTGCKRGVLADAHSTNKPEKDYAIECWKGLLQQGVDLTSGKSRAKPSELNQDRETDPLTMALAPAGIFLSSKECFLESESSEKSYQTVTHFPGFHIGLNESEYSWYWAKERASSNLMCFVSLTQCEWFWGAVSTLERICRNGPLRQMKGRCCNCLTMKILLF